MSFEVLPPQFDSTKKFYTFTFKHAPRIEVTTKDPSKLIVMEGDSTEQFLKEFLQQASKYFSKSLDLAMFYKRAVYHWITDEVDSQTYVNKEETFRATWIPARILFYPTRYEVYFTLVEVEIVSFRIPPGFLDDLSDSNNLKTELPELPITEIMDDDIPYKVSSSEEKIKREGVRKHIRQARLRASLARLRAEELADRYWKRYGNFEMDGSESELTSDGETEATKI